ncbi:hypothetical protein AXX17_AT3G32030 [Arabidopsis thaliana]|uniref:Uncharacterized protein n=1 Tax=Arabidopsis thaliana TaxID=3702 RepID=A0A178VAB3_ARATH|nr:hypothetical protein AXX17_AT3G32030 [Arabidopsis thaliana]
MVSRFWLILFLAIVVVRIVVPRFGYFRLSVVEYRLFIVLVSIIQYIAKSSSI